MRSRATTIGACVLSVATSIPAAAHHVGEDPPVASGPAGRVFTELGHMPSDPLVILVGGVVIAGLLGGLLYLSR